MPHELSLILDEALDDSLNARGRSAAHVASGFALLAGAVLVSALAAYRKGPSGNGLEAPPVQPSRRSFASVWPPMFLLLAMSAIRIWNAPASLERSRALMIWVGLQGLHAASMLADVTSQSGRLASNLATMAGAVFYVRDARKVDPPSGAIVAPYVSWMAFVSLIAGALWRRDKDRPGVK